jgi:hypothetical protein
MVSSCEDESDTDVPVLSSSANPDTEQLTERVSTDEGVREFLCRPKTANLRNNTKVLVNLLAAYQLIYVHKRA